MLSLAQEVGENDNLFKALFRQVLDGLVGMGFDEFQARKLHLGPLLAQGALETVCCVPQA
tara:strand:- start:142 stop:321 length:180 start_codon:yes stop_codon:yes gene_type:complete